MGAFRKFKYATSNKELGILNRVRKITLGENTEGLEEGGEFAGLDNPEFFLRVQGEKAPADLSPQELQERYEKHGIETPLSGDDMGKMGLTRLRPGQTMPGVKTMGQEGSTHIYRTMQYYDPISMNRPLTPPDRGDNPDRRPGV